MNANIPYREVFVISEEGEKLGLYQKDKILQIAKEQGKDLVLIATDPTPVVRILDYGKFKYISKKNQKEKKEKQSNVQNKEIRLTPFIGKADLETKSKKAREYLLKGDRIKVSLKLRGREIARKELGFETLDKFYQTLVDICDSSLDVKNPSERFLNINLLPNKQKIAKYLKDLKKKTKIKIYKIRTNNAKNEN
nr:translation initiation factor IF-3 [Mycoplasmopsis synoviae]